MRVLGSLPIIFMVVLAMYAFWDLGINGFQPPVAPDQLGEKNPEIEQVMSVHREALKTGLSNTIVPQIDESLTLIVEEYGEFSAEHNQALVDTGIMLAASSRSDLADDYMQKAVEVSREVYGTDHRETALALNDLANLVTESSGRDFTEESITYLTEALEIRRNVLDADHPEVVVNEVNLADQLFIQWQADNNPEDKTNLERATNLLTHVMEVHAAQGDAVNPLDKAGVQLLFARISFYQDDFENAEKYFSETLSAVAPETDPATYLVFANSYAEHITALNRLGREQEATQMQEDILRFVQQANAGTAAPQPADTEAQSEAATPDK